MFGYGAFSFLLGTDFSDCDSISVRWIGRDKVIDALLSLIPYSKTEPVAKCSCVISPFDLDPGPILQMYTNGPFAIHRLER